MELPINNVEMTEKWQRFPGMLGIQRQKDEYQKFSLFRLSGILEKSIWEL